MTPRDALIHRRSCMRVLFVFTACIASSTALGQSLEPAKTLGVRDRPRPEYDPLGIQIGTFTAFPALTLSTSYDDNIYATDIDPQSDTIWGIGGRLNLQSDWGTHALSLFAGGNSDIYSANTSQNNTNWEAGGKGTLVVSRRMSISVNGDFNHLHEPREDADSPVGAAEPVAYDLGEATIAVAEDLSPLTLTVTGQYASYDYSDVDLIGGGLLSQGFRDNEIWTVTGRAAISVSKDTSFFLQASNSDRLYALKPPVVSIDRDAVYREYLAGAAFDITNLTRGELGVGYFTLDNRDPTQSDRQGFAVNGSVEWFVTQLMTVTLTAVRKSDEAALTGSAGSIETGGGARIDYELLRNVIISAGGSYEDDDYVGIDRDDKMTAAEVSAKWLIDRHASFIVDYAHRNRDSQGTSLGPKFEENIVSASIKFTL